MPSIFDFINYLLEVVKPVIAGEAQRCGAATETASDLQYALIDRTINPNWRFNYLQIIFATGAS
jgi:hypothetical protein